MLALVPDLKLYYGQPPDMSVSIVLLRNSFARVSPLGQHLCRRSVGGTGEAASLFGLQQDKDSTSERQLENFARRCICVLVVSGNICAFLRRKLDHLVAVLSINLRFIPGCFCLRMILTEHSMVQLH